MIHLTGEVALFYTVVAAKLLKLAGSATYTGQTLYRYDESL